MTWEEYLNKYRDPRRIDIIQFRVCVDRHRHTHGRYKSPYISTRIYMLYTLGIRASLCKM